MSLLAAVAQRPDLLILGATTGLLLGPVAATSSVTVVDGGWPWQSGSARWPLGEPASGRRRVVIAMSAAVVLAGLAAVIGWRPAMLAFLAMGIIGLILGVIDLEHHRLPDRLTLSGALVSGLSLFLDAAVTGSWPLLLRGSVCAGVAFLAFLIMALISPSGMGLGDVKLAALLSLHTGWLSWQLAVVAMIGGFAIGAAAALVLALARRATLATAIPFGPALLFSAWLAIFLSGPVG